MLLFIFFTKLFFTLTFCCAPDEFQCRDKTCITQNFRCDNFRDCKDGSDEIGCITTGCQPHEFRCESGMCIAHQFRCDNFEDCKDGSDEIGCNTIQQENCNKDCKEPTLLYEDLNCKPINHFVDQKCCPSAFDCSHIEARTNQIEEKCYFHGRSYSIGEIISHSEIYGSCRSNCTCQKTSSGYLVFDCKMMKCPEWIYHNNKPGCRLKYELGKCCSTGQICGPFQASCYIDGKIYSESQRYESPFEKCTYCVCKSGYTHSSVCTKYQCVQEIQYHNEVMRFCAPSYLTMNDCCPINWICPHNDKIIISKAIHKPSLRCRFGNVYLNIGDKFKRVHKPRGGKVVCECRIPPYLTCIQDYMYPTGKV